MQKNGKANNNNSLKGRLSSATPRQSERETPWTDTAKLREDVRKHREEIGELRKVANKASLKADYLKGVKEDLQQNMSIQNTNVSRANVRYPEANGNSPEAGKYNRAVREYNQKTVNAEMAKKYGDLGYNKDLESSHNRIGEAEKGLRNIAEKAKKNITLLSEIGRQKTQLMKIPERERELTESGKDLSRIRAVSGIAKRKIENATTRLEKIPPFAFKNDNLNRRTNIRADIEFNQTLESERKWNGDLKAGRNAEANRRGEHEFRGAAGIMQRAGADLTGKENWQQEPTRLLNRERAGNRTFANMGSEDYWHTTPDSLSNSKQMDSAEKLYKLAGRGGTSSQEQRANLASLTSLAVPASVQQSGRAMQEGPRNRVSNKMAEKIAADNMRELRNTKPGDPLPPLSKNSYARMMKEAKRRDRSGAWKL